MQSSRHWFLLSHKADQREGLKYPSSCRPIFLSESCQFRMVLCSRVSALFCHLASDSAWWIKYMPVTWAFRGASGEPKKPSTGQASTSKSQNSSQGAAFATATNQSSRKNLWNVTKYLNDHGRASQQTCLSAMVPSTWLQLTAILISSSWIYWRLRQLERLLTSWNLIWQDMVFQTNSPQTTAHSLTVLSFRSLPLSTSLNTLKRLHGILSLMGRLRTVSKQQRITWKRLLMQAMTHTCLYWTSGIHHQKEWTAPLNVSSRLVIPNVYQNLQQTKAKQASCIFWIILYIKVVDYFEGWKKYDKNVKRYQLMIEWIILKSLQASFSGQLGRI